jgi:hypothetical protein
VGPRTGLDRRLGGTQNWSGQEAGWDPELVWRGGWVGPRTGLDRRLGGTQNQSGQEAAWDLEPVWTRRLTKIPSSIPVIELRSSIS